MHDGSTLALKKAFQNGLNYSARASYNDACMHLGSYDMCYDLKYGEWRGGSGDGRGSLSCLTFAQMVRSTAALTTTIASHFTPRPGWINMADRKQSSRESGWAWGPWLVDVWRATQRGIVGGAMRGQCTAPALNTRHTSWPAITMLPRHNSHTHRDIDKAVSHPPTATHTHTHCLTYVCVCDLQQVMFRLSHLSVPSALTFQAATQQEEAHTSRRLVSSAKHPPGCTAARCLGVPPHSPYFPGKKTEDKKTWWTLVAFQTKTHVVAWWAIYCVARRKLKIWRDYC